jgi:hypothetical protein
MTRTPTYPSPAQRRGLSVLIDALGRLRARAAPHISTAAEYKFLAQEMRRANIDRFGRVTTAFGAAMRMLAFAHEPATADNHEPRGRQAYASVRALYTSHDPSAWPEVERDYAAAVRGKSAARSLPLEDACAVALLRSAMAYYAHDAERVTAAGVMDIRAARAALRGQDPCAARLCLSALSIPPRLTAQVEVLAEQVVRSGFGEDAPADWWPHTVARFGQENAEAALRVAATSVLHRLGRR